MTQLMKQRPLAVWCLFLAGAVTGGIASSLMEPQHVWAETTDLNGQKFAELELRVSELSALLQGISRDPDSGAFVFKDSTRSVELLGPTATIAVVGNVSIEYPDPDFAPALQVVGRTVLTGDPGPDQPLVGIDPLMLHPTHGVVEITDPDGTATWIDPGKIELSHPEGATRLGWNLVELLGPAGKTTVHPAGIELLDELASTTILPFGIELLDEAAFTTVRPDRIELLHSAGAEPVRLGVAEDGSYLSMGLGAFRVEGPAYATDFIDTDEVIDPF